MYSICFVALHGVSVYRIVFVCDELKKCFKLKSKEKKPFSNQFLSSLSWYLSRALTNVAQYSMLIWKTDNGNACTRVPY